MNNRCNEENYVKSKSLLKIPFFTVDPSFTHPSTFYAVGEHDDRVHILVPDEVPKLSNCCRKRSLSSYETTSTKIILLENISYSTCK